ncbi:hypothetical protein JCM11641_003475 [Rhodosporidiobolus odoratus]
MSFGPGSAFSFAAPIRPPRRNNSSGSFKDTLTTPSSSSLLNGPSPVDPPTAPSLGSFGQQDGLIANGLAAGAVSGTSEGSARSFSSILSPTLSAAANGGQLGGENGNMNGAGQPFVYSRDFLLSLYDEEKASKRPLELASHQVATRELGGEDGATHRPWLLQDYREGEKDLFATSIHPANARPSRNNRTDSSLSTNGASATLDLSTLGTLPRDRDRALGSPSIRSPSVEKDSLLSSSGRERRNRERSAGGTMGILGGVLGGIASGTPTRKREENGAKEVWQGGRWRRGAQEAEETEKRTSAFGSRRFPLPEDADSSRPASPVQGNAVPDSWDEGEPDGKPTGSAALNGDATTPDVLSNEPDITASVLGSLALDSDPLDDPLLAKPATPTAGAQTPARPTAPPGLSSVPPAEVQWQYRDPSGTVQGPFPAATMHDWYCQQFFTPDLRVKRTSDLDFESLENVIRRTGDSDKPFLAPKPVTAPTSAFSSAPGTPQGAASWGTGSVGRAQTPLEQLTAAVAQGRLGTSAGSFYEPFGSAAPSPAAQAQTLPQAFGAATAALGRSSSTQGGLDPWGAPLPAVNSPAWTGATLPQQQQQDFAGQQPSLATPSDILLRQLAQQAAQQQSFSQSGVLDPFGRPSPLPASPFFDPSQLLPGAAASPTAWIGQQLPHQQQQQALLQQAQQLGQQPWAALAAAAAAAAAPSVPAGGSPAVQHQQNLPASVLTPIGSRSVAPSTQQSPTQPQQAASQSPWDAAKPAAPAQPETPAPAVVEVKQTVVAPEPPTPSAPVAAVVVEEVKVEAPAPAPAKEKGKRTKVSAAQPTPVVVEKAPSPVAEPAPAPIPAKSPPAAAPWAKEEVVAVAVPAASPSLREIQEAETRESDKRKQAARIQAAQANIQAAQRAAALEAQTASEALPLAASWAAGPAQVPPVKGGSAPWIKSAPAAATAAKASGKTLKEIQEEEEKRKKAQAAAQQQQAAAVGATVSAGKGYAGSIGQATPAAGGAAWTTVAVKPAVVRAATAAKPLIPGLPSTATTASSARAAGSTGLPVKAAAPAAVSRPAVTSSASSAKVTIVPRSVSVHTPATAVYDMENPPPPSPEFMSWTKQALKGLNVPHDEFIQMLLSFPLDASADVLEIISDSVYANSSTLDGRRFANDFATRRKNDVAVRYPSIFAKGVVRALAAAGAAKTGGSMAAVLSAPAQTKTSEWNVKVSAKKKKGGK